MKMHKIIFLAFLAFQAISTSAQTAVTQTIKGLVLDGDSEYPLIGVNVILLDNGEAVGTSTDLDGFFEITNVPLGRQSIALSYIGYKDQTVPNILVNSGKEITLEIRMEEDLQTLQEVVITDKQDKRSAVNEMASISARSMNMEELVRFSGTTGDVARMAQNYAGVSGSSDDRNDIIVRGNSPSTVLWRMEGVDIPSPNHWATLGSTGGPISMLNANSLRSSDFLSSAFPAEYGNATGAVFDLKLRNGNKDRFEFLGQIGFNGFEGGIEGPLSIGKNASFIINYRYSTLGVFKALGINFGTGSSVPQYQDLNFKVNVPTENAGRFTFWGLGGVSDILFQASSEDEDLFTDGDQNLQAGSDTGILGFSHLYFFNEKTSSNLALSASGTISENFVEEIINSNSQEFEKIFTNSNYQGKLGLNWTINSKINAKNRIKTGVIVDFYDINVLDSVLVDDSFWFTSLDFDGNASLYRAFGQWQHKFNEKLTMNLGLHTSLFGLNNATTFEPRLGFTYAANERNTFAIGYGRHSQLQPLLIYFNKERDVPVAQNEANLDLEMIKSDHLVVAWDYLLSPNSRLKLEAYYQGLSDVAVDPDDGSFSLINFGADFGFPNRTGLVNEGTGENIGMELTLERFLSKGFYTLMTVSVFDSSFKGTDKVKRNTFYNSNYVTNLLMGKEFVLNEKLSLTVDGKINVAGGRRYTPIDLPASIALGEEVRDESRIFEEQFAPYIRPDIKIGFRLNGKNYSQSFSVDLQNVINRQNEFTKSYNEETMEIRTSYQRGFFPDVRYQILF